ncbi:alkylhydroperoxidase/carboxymuconolactone decarboxylase family protein YurZ [Robbsia andropogonis]|uniref:carboxymuconolactone decarboxylase family protein n=1 Tax=Robbsia andropogonis TaxID=28092 RepID=UPI0020A1193E|nr:carboxymuconolactone decarboxylase family protein [Robbsia andropogonis]MCP1120486.1 carboxymuconolactone decarboxylase family protein [Robbsia andropogonis]MCP1130358.1 carboxymuconolactone decarboxylase family protein [Robbsia andropogonis]
MPSDEIASRIREHFRSRRGYWNDDWERLLLANPAYVAAYLELSAYTAERGCLSPKTRELIYVATNCSPTHFFERGVRQHARFAREHGASLEELIAVAMVVSMVGVQTYLLGALALEELVPGVLSSIDHKSYVETVHKKHLQLLGAALPEVHAAIDVDPAFYDAWLNFASAAMGENGPLSAKDCHLVALAAYAQCTQLSGPGVRQHMRAALANGATPNEIMDVCKLITSMGVHAVVLPVPVLIDEWGKSP